MGFYENNFLLKISHPPTMPTVLTKIAKKKYHFKWISSLKETMIGDKIKIYPYTYFSPVSFHKKEIKKNLQSLIQNSYAIHHWDNSWGKKKKIWKNIKNIPWAFLPYIYKEQLLSRIKMYLKNKELFF